MRTSKIAVAWIWALLPSAAALPVEAPAAGGKELPIPTGPEPKPLEARYFPGRLDAFIFRNWGLVPVERVAAVLGGSVSNVNAVARALGIGDYPPVSDEHLRRSAVTIIRRNWHLLPYSQLVRLLGWTEGQLGYALREDDFLWTKLGGLKPKCEALEWAAPGAEAEARRREIGGILREVLGEGGLRAFVPRFSFLEELRGAKDDPRRCRGEPRPGEVDLTRGWKLAPGEGLGETALQAIRDFQRRSALEQGVVLGSGGGDAGAGTGVIQLEVAQGGNSGSSESHEIRVAPEKIRITACGDEGILRALQHLCLEMRERGGPYLATGEWKREPRFQVRFLYSYFALYGDALLEPGLDPYPDGYLEKLSLLGVNGVWLPVLLRGMAPESEALGLVPAGEAARKEREARLSALADLVRRTKRHGIGVYLYLNEPRAMPLEFFRDRPALQGVSEGNAAALCTSVPSVREWLSASVAHVFSRVPELAGVFTITASENLTSCYSHHGGKACPRCRERTGAEVIAEVNRAIFEGARRASPSARVIAWDWGWPDDWIEATIQALPEGIAVMSVSEWSLPIQRGGISSAVGEYSISCVGPGPRARRTWGLAKARGLSTFAKVQAGTTWELSAVPYIPAVRLSAEHARRLTDEPVDGLMLGWTLGGYPSVNLEAVAAFHFRSEPGKAEGLEDILSRVALRRFGPVLGPRVAWTWNGSSDAFLEYPYHTGLVYASPIQWGPANPLYPEETGYRATMVGIPYDDLDGWRAIYPPEVFAGQFERVAKGWSEALRSMPPLEGALPEGVLEAHARAYRLERCVAEACLLHFQSVAAQGRFVLGRRAWRSALDRKDVEAARAHLADMESLARAEEETAVRLLSILKEDSRIGFEATNHYYYVPVDVLEKLMGCRWIRETWIPAARAALRP